MKVLPVVLCGGSGSRLWPLSREKDPKPFVKLKDDLSLIQHAYKRAGDCGNVGKVLTIANKDLSFRVKSHFDELALAGVQNINMLEPCAKNTAPAITMAALYAKAVYGDDVCLLVLAADHLIDGDELFNQAVKIGVNLAEQGKLVTFGIKPKRPETGYGYILHQGDSVLKFVEKPDAKTAQEYLDNGNYLWNSGIFCFMPSVFLAELQVHCPEMFAELSAVYDSIAQDELSENTNQINIPEETFAKVTEDSIDYAVMERSEKVAVVPCGFEWSDVGSWDSLARAFDDNDNNVIFGEECEHILNNVHNSFIYAKDRMVAVIGVKDLVIVDTDDALLVADRHQSQEIKKVYQELKNKDSEQYKLHHRTPSVGYLYHIR